MIEPATIHRVTELALVCDGWAWPFATARRAEIDAHFGVRQAEKPELWNGRVLLARNPVFGAGRLRADYFETDFASFLAWRDWGYPDRSVVNGFGMGALRSSDGAFALGEMGSHTANAGRVYFPGGTPDRNDLRGAVVDIAASVAREVEEETGLAPGSYRAAGHWDVVVDGPLLAMIRVLDVDLPGEALRARITANLARQDSPELAAIHLVRGRGDFAPTMPRFVTTFIDHTVGAG